MAVTKLTVKDVQAMNRKVMQEALEDLTAMGAEEIRKLTSAKMREELMAIAKPEKKTPREKAVTRMADEVVKATRVKDAMMVPIKVPKLRGEGKDKGKECECLCGGRTKGGRFLPGHDAKLHSKQNGGGKKAPKECLCGCVDSSGRPRMTKGGRFLPGHDAKYHNQLAKEEKEEKKGKVA